MTTNYTLDLAAGLTQVLDDGPNTYLYGNGRIAQAGSTTEYFLGDALGSVRQLVDNAGAVMLTQSYAPYGETISSVGSGYSAYQYTGEIRDASGLTFLRARYLNNSTGTFVSRDIWLGDYHSPMSYNKWVYAYQNPITFLDPTGMKPGDSKYCVPLTGLDRQYCENIVRGIEPDAKLTVKDYFLLDWSGDCYSPNLENRLPHSLYRGTYKEFGWWWHYLLDTTPGWWNENGKGHIYFKDVVTFALAAELSTAVENFPAIIGYAAGAFANKGWEEGFYYTIGSRQSVYMRVNNAVYGSSEPDEGAPYNYNEFGIKFGNEINNVGSLIFCVEVPYMGVSSKQNDDTLRDAFLAFFT